MTPQEHYHEAEMLVERAMDDVGRPWAMGLIAAAQVHATLATHVPERAIAVEALEL